MKNKIIGMLVCTLIIAAAVSPVVGTFEINRENGITILIISHNIDELLYIVSKQIITISIDYCRVVLMTFVEYQVFNKA